MIGEITGKYDFCNLGTVLGVQLYSFDFGSVYLLSISKGSFSMNTP